MACAEPVESKRTVWTWCKKWGVPYPCRRTKTVTVYQYEFDQLRFVPSTFPFWQKKEGCCGGIIYKWKKWVTWNTPKPFGWSYHNPPIALEFSEKLESNGACPPRDSSDVLIE